MTMTNKQIISKYAGENHNEVVAKAKAKQAIALELDQDKTYQEGQFNLALSRASLSAKVKRSMLSTTIQDKISARLAEIDAVAALPPQERVKLESKGKPEPKKDPQQAVAQQLLAAAMSGELGARAKAIAETFAQLEAGPEAGEAVDLGAASLPD